MANVKDLAAAESQLQKLRQAQLAERVRKSEDQQNTILTEMMKHTIVDKLVPPDKMSFWRDQPQFNLGLPGAFGIPGKERYSIHRHALGQMADVSGLTRGYLWKLHDSSPKDHHWRWGLLATNLETLFTQTEFVTKKGKPKRFLVRVVGNEVRGFLSQNFNRKLMTAPLLRTFIDKARELGAGPTEVSATDVRVRVKYMLPFVFEPVDGEFVSFGVTFGNSDFGAGRLMISGSVMRISSETTSVLSDSYSRTHLGSILQDEDLDDTDWVSNETADKEVEAHRGYIRDKVTSILGLESVERTLKAIQVAHEKKIPWYQLKDRLKEILTKQDLEGLLTMAEMNNVTDLPKIESEDNKPQATAWWAANAVSAIANKETDPDRKSDLQAAAGRLLEG